MYFLSGILVTESDTETHHLHERSKKKNEVVIARGNLRQKHVPVGAESCSVLGILHEEGPKRTVLKAVIHLQSMLNFLKTLYDCSYEGKWFQKEDIVISQGQWEGLF